MLVSAKEELEAKVQERTAELARANEQLHTYTREIVRVQEAERKRVAIELHDDTAQNLALLALEIDKLLDRKDSLSPDTLAHLQVLRADVNRTQNEVRRFSHDLRPGVLDYLGLEAALEGLANDTKEKGNLEVDFEVQGKSRRLPDEVELSLFRIAQEALVNSQKHSQATRASISLQFSPDKVRVVTADNGTGFDVKADTQSAVRRRRLGMVGMRERAVLIGGKLRIKSIIGVGSTVSIEVKQ
jgi:two-component system, NarL family, sensor histidine kinase DegS